MRLLVLLATVGALIGGDQPGDTRVCTWRDDRTAAFLLMFDDGWPSHFQVAAPELHRRGLTATFYINPSKGEYAKFPKEWEQVRALGMVMANHTMSHQGASSATAAIKEIDDCQAYLLKTIPGREPRLISFGMPGVKQWELPREQHQAALARNHLVDRPPFANHGAVYHLKTTDEMLALADKAIAAKGMEYLVIHGVERIVPNWSYQDFWALKQTIFLPLLDGLKERSDRGDLWITDHITWHQYQEERRTAAVKVLEAGPERIRIELATAADPALYDQPLTLSTRVPAGWTACTVTQGTRQAAATAKDGCVRYDAVPGGGPIGISPAK